VADLTALLRPIYELTDPAEGIPALLAVCDPEVEFRPAGLWLDDKGVNRGHAEVAGFFERLQEVFGELRFTPERFEERADAVAVELRLEVRGRHSGIPDSREMGHLWRFRDGRVVEIVAYETFAEALDEL
jgi:ketosteroid isomerase-like protein